MFFFIFASICQFLRGFPTRLGLSCFLQPAVAFAALLLFCFVLEIRPWDISTNGLGQDDPARHLTAARYREYMRISHLIRPWHSVSSNYRSAGYAALLAKAGAHGLNLDTMDSLGPFVVPPSQSKPEPWHNLRIS